MSGWLNKSGVLMLCLLLLHVQALAQVVKEDEHFIGDTLKAAKKISMDFKNVAIMDIFKIFSKQTGINFIVAEDIGSKQVNMFLENVPIDEALNQMLSAYNLEYESREGSNIYYVHKATSKDKLITKVIALKYASVPSSKINSALSISGSSGASRGASMGGGTSGSAYGGIMSALSEVMSKAGSMVDDPRTNSLVITDVQSRFPLIEETIAKLDVPVAQILIEVEMLDISKTTSDLMGVKWGGSFFSFTGASKYSLLPFNQSAALQDGKTLLTPASDSSSSSGGSSSSATTSPYTISTTGGNLDFSGMKALVQFLKTRSDTRSLARPRLLTLNNETAQIKVSTDEAIGVTSSSVGSTSSTSQTVTAERVQTGVFLTVTPQANLSTGEILLAVNPRVIQARTGATFSSSSGPVTFKDPEERGTQALLRVQDGNTIIIGGLLRKENSNTITKVPFLGDIPFLGNAFRHKDKSDVERELIIFLTPHIVTDNNKDKIITKNVTNVSNWGIKDSLREDEIENDLKFHERKK